MLLEVVYVIKMTSSALNIEGRARGDHEESDMNMRFVSNDNVLHSDRSLVV